MNDDFHAFLLKVEDQILTPIITLISLAAFVVFVWGIVQFIAAADDQEKRKTGQRHMIWGVIGLVIIFGANAIITILRKTIGI